MCYYGKRVVHLGRQRSILGVSVELLFWRRLIAISVAGAFHPSRSFPILSSNVSSRAEASLIVHENGIKLQYSYVFLVLVSLVLFVTAHAQAKWERGRWEYVIMGSENAPILNMQVRDPLAKRCSAVAVCFLAYTRMTIEIQQLYTFAR